MIDWSDCKKTAYTDRAIHRFNCEKSCIGITLSFKNHDTSSEDMNSKLLDMVNSISPLKCPKNMIWRLKSYTEKHDKLPFLTLYPFDCSRHDSIAFNQKLIPYHNWTWGRIQYPIKDDTNNFCMNENKNAIYSPSPTFILWQHIQILNDLCMEIYNKTDDLTILSETISLVETSLCNFKTTHHFNVQKDVDISLLSKSICKNIHNIMFMKDIIKHNHPNILSNIILNLYEKYNTDTYNLKNILFIACNKIQDINFFKNQLCDIINKNVCSVYKFDISQILNDANPKILKDISILYCYLSMIKFLMKIHRSGPKQLLYFMIRTKRYCNSIHNSMTLINDLYDIEKFQLANCICAKVVFGETNKNDFYNTNATDILKFHIPNLI